MQQQSGNDAKKQREKEQRVLSRRTQLSVLLMLTILIAGCGAARPVKYYVLDVNPAPTNTAAGANTRDVVGGALDGLASIS